MRLQEDEEGGRGRIRLGNFIVSVMILVLDRRR